MVGIVCTGEPPFYALSNRGPPAFVPARDLQTGDTLTLADGGKASVVSLAQEFAPSRESFTTYNFEVADFHTYFAGPAGGVWVHNFSQHFCQKLFSVAKLVMEDLGIASPTGERVRILEAAFEELSKGARNVLDALTGNRNMMAASFEELAEYSQHGDPSKVGTYTKLRAIVKKYFGRPPAHNFDVHHLCERRVSKALGMSEDAVLADGTKLIDSTPAINLPRRASLWTDTKEIADVFPGKKVVFHQGPDSLTEAIGDAFEGIGLSRNYSGGRLPSAQQKQLILRLKNIYAEDARFKHLNAWPATRDWMASNFPDMASFIRTL